ncbi:MAG: hypothetical protein MJZ16_01825, partial [Bacteroidales bacterium]|nr:hypothetical protein [Bacteroidales bacterium]
EILSTFEEINIQLTQIKNTFDDAVNGSSSNERKLAGTEWRMDYGFIDPDMVGYFLGIRFTDDTHAILAEGDPEDGFWDDYPVGTGTYTINEDGTVTIDLFDDEGEEQVFEGFFQGDLFFLVDYYDAYYEDYGDGCAFVQYLGE